MNKLRKLNRFIQNHNIETCVMGEKLFAGDEFYQDDNWHFNWVEIKNYQEARAFLGY